MEKIICVVGPTASGKTGLSIRLAQALGGEVLSCDSMQIYQGMDIGTAKVAPAEMQGVQHHMLDLIQPSEDYSVSRFVTEAEPICRAWEKVFSASGAAVCRIQWTAGLRRNQVSCRLA